MSEGGLAMSSRTPSKISTPARIVSTIVLTVALLGALATTALATAAPSVSVRVEGAQRTVFNAVTSAGAATITDSDGATHAMSGNPICALDSAAQLGAFPYVAENGSLGLYVSSINAELPVASPPYPGWLFRVNGARVDVGADQVALHSGDSVLWYYGTWDASPTVAAVPAAAVAVGSSATIVAEQLDPNGVASPLPGATVHVGSVVATSDAEGKVVVPMTKYGNFGVRVEKDGCIRSALAMVHVRYAASFPRFSANKSIIRRRAKVTLIGKLSLSGKAAARRTVTLMHRKKGTTAWVTGQRTTTAANGWFAFKVSPARSTQYKVVFLANSQFSRGTTKVKLITVR
jgi:hypothetical protein